MAESNVRFRRPIIEDPTKEREVWVQLLKNLINDVEKWVRPKQWSTRVIEKEMRDSVLGEYHAPALLMQREIARVLLEPITRFAPRTDGVVDLYLMPAFDDIATLYRVDGEWKLHYAFRGHPVGTGIRNATALPLTEENFSKVLDSITSHAS